MHGIEEVPKEWTGLAAGGTEVKVYVGGLSRSRNTPRVVYLSENFRVFIYWSFDRSLREVRQFRTDLFVLFMIESQLRVVTKMMMRRTMFLDDCLLVRFGWILTFPRMN